MADDVANFAIGTVAGAAPGSGGLTLETKTGEGSRFTAVPPYNCVTHPANEQPTPANAEIVRVTARSGDKFTIERAQEGTAAKSIAVGWSFEQAPTRKTIKDLVPLAEKGAASGVATLDTNTLVPLAELPIYEIENPETATLGEALTFVHAGLLKFAKVASSGISETKAKELINELALPLEHPLGRLVTGSPGGSGNWIPAGNTAGGFSWQHLTGLLAGALNSLSEVAITVSTTVLSNAYCVCTGTGITVKTPGSLNVSDLLVVTNANALGGASVVVKGTFTLGSPGVETTKTLNPGETLILLANGENVWRTISESRTLALIEALIQQTGRTLQPTGENEPIRILKNKVAPYNGPVEEHQTSAAVSQWQRLTNGGMLWSVPGTSSEPTLQVKKAADLIANLRYQLNSDGTMHYGPGGSSGTHPLDTTWGRSRPGVMAAGALEANKVAGAPASVGVGAFQGTVNGAAPTLPGSPTAEELALEYNVDDWWVDEADGTIWIVTVKGGAIGATKPGTFLNTSRRDLATEMAGLATQPFDLPTTGKALTEKLLYLIKVPWPRTRSIKAIVYAVTTAAGSEPTLGRLSVYGELSGGKMSLLGFTADQKAHWAAAPQLYKGSESRFVKPGEESKNITIEPKGGPGLFLYVGILGIGTMPSLAAANWIGREQDINYGLGKSEYRAGRGVTPAAEESFSVLPAEIEPGKSINSTGKPAPLFWAGLEP